VLKAVATPAKIATRRMPGREGREEANFIRSREAQKKLGLSAKPKPSV
jgi:hypothetical protein